MLQYLVLNSFHSNLYLVQLRLLLIVSVILDVFFIHNMYVMYFLRVNRFSFKGGLIIRYTLYKAKGILLL